MPITKATFLAWWANFISGALFTGGLWMAFFDEHYRGIGAITVLLGIGVQYYFKNKAHKELVRHNKAIEIKK